MSVICVLGFGTWVLSFHTWKWLGNGWGMWLFCLSSLLILRVYGLGCVMDGKIAMGM